MTENLQVTITLSAPQLEPEELQEAVLNLKQEVQAVDGVKQADLIPVEQAPPSSKSIGGFLLGMFKAIVSPKNLLNLFQTLGQNLFGRTIYIKVEKNSRKPEAKLSRPEDLAAIMPEVERFINS